MQESMTYKDAGVSIEAGNEFVDRIKKHVQPTFRPEVLSHLGGFGAFFEIPEGYRQPVMVSCTDGVGTKLRLALAMQKHDTIGIDCVAMCANDCVVSGAEPLWFLDYYATGKLDIEVAEQVVKGIAQGCLESGMSLVGGETAEMPDMYQHDDYDIAGFCVGIVEKSKIIDGQSIQAGDQLIALPSSGVHSNGFSLVRKLLETSKTKLDMPFAGKTIGEVLLAPTRLYVTQTLTLARASLLKGAAHITGGGLTENIPRILPPGLGARIDLTTWQRPEIFEWLKKTGNIPQDEMLTTFNCGVGMVYAVSAADVDATYTLLRDLGETPIHLGSIEVSSSLIRYEGAW